MNNILVLVVLLVLDFYYALRFANLPVEPDFATFSTWGMLGAVYGRDYVDCKTPLVHGWLALLSQIKKEIIFIRLAHFVVTGFPSFVYYLLTKDYAGAIAFMVLIHSGWLLAFHGNVGDIPAGLTFIALIVNNPWVFVGLLVLATLYEPKLIVATGVMVLTKITSVWLPLTVYIGLFSMGLAALYYWQHPTFDWIVESSFTIPKRMLSYRKGLYGFMPQFTSVALVFLLPWLLLAILSRPEPLYWLAPALFLGLQFTGKVIRPNHLLPLVAWIAASGIKPELVYALSATEFLSSGLYLGDIWRRFYPALADIVKDAKSVGEWLRDKPGVLWVNTMYTEIYLYARKKPIYGMMEVVEVNDVANERRKIMRSKINRQPPEWIVIGAAGIEYDYKQYQVAAKSGFFQVLKRRQA